MTNLAIKVLLMGALASIFGRAIAAEPKPGHMAREGGFVDIDLPISDHRFAQDGTLAVVARGKIEDQVVAIAVELGAKWKEQAVEGAGLTIYWGQGHIRSVGEESDAFLGLLAKAYAVRSPSAKMAARTKLTTAGLNSDPRKIEAAPASIKVFFEHNGQDHYGEAFINIDLAKGVLEFHDKDPEYHQGIVSSLAADD